MQLKPSNSGKATVREPKVAQVRHTADVDNHTCQENAQHGANIVTCVDIKIISVCIAGPGTEKTPKTDQHKSTCRGSKDPREARHMRRSRSRHRRQISGDSDRSRSDTWSAHSTESNSFQDHPDELHERHSFQVSCEESTNFVKKTFNTIYRSKLTAKTSNDTDPDGKTKIITILNIKLLH